MRQILAVLLFSAAAPASQEASLTGKWEVFLSVSGYEVTMQCSFTQEGQELEGSCTSENGTVEVKGKVEEKNVTWPCTSEGGGEKHDVRMKGVIESGSKMKGTVEVLSYGVEGDFTATRKD